MDETNQAPQANSGQKKGLYIIVAIVVIALALYFLGGLGTPQGMLGGVGGVNIDQNADGSATYTSSDGTVTVNGNKLPDNWPSDAPTYPNAAIQYSGSSNPQTGAEGSAVSFTTSDSVQTVTDFYKRELVSKGWVIDQSASVGGATVLTAKKDTRTFGTYITDAGNGQIAVTVGIEMPDTQ